MLILRFWIISSSSWHFSTLGVYDDNLYSECKLSSCSESPCRLDVYISQKLFFFDQFQKPFRSIAYIAHCTSISLWSALYSRDFPLVVITVVEILCDFITRHRCLLSWIRPNILTRITVRFSASYRFVRSNLVLLGEIILFSRCTHVSSL